MVSSKTADLARDFSEMGKPELKALIELSHPEVIDACLETQFPSTGLLFQRLTNGDVETIENLV
jgi:hypothetical protein